VGAATARALSGRELGEARLDRAQQLDDRVGGVGLQRPVLRVVVGQGHGIAVGDRAEDRQQVRHPGLGGGIEAHGRVGVGDGALDLLGHLAEVLEHQDGALGRVGRLRHLPRRLLEVHHPRAHRRDGGLGDDERVAVAMVEADGEVARQLEVLALVVTHGHAIGVVEQDVGRHQRGIGQQAGRHEVRAFGLVLELGHATELAERCRALEDPGQLGVLVHVALDEERGHVGIDADGEQQLGQLERAGPEVGGILRDGERVQVDDAVEGVGSVLVGHPVAQRAEQVAELHVAAWLDAREDTSHERRC